MRRICVLLGILLGVASLPAQMEVLDANTPPLDAENLIRNVFLGSGVEVSNVEFEGDNAAIGFFKDGNTAIGIERGIVMTSGRAASNAMTGIIGSEANGNAGASNPTSSNASDPDVTQIASDVVRDLAIFTITFTPISDTLEFKYVFASEEYPVYVCSDFNDVFGFFISGPGITGPYENNGANIALIPGTNLPVTINNLNSGMVGSQGTPANCDPPNGSLANSQFYVNNNGPTQPVYNGLTTVLTARAIVIPCETYTIKLAVSDVGDGALDSGVFLEAKSFGTGTLDVVASTLSLDGAVAEGCEPAILTFEVPVAPKNDFPLDYTIFGTAINGVDYETIPSDIFIPAGDTLITIPVIPINDGITEGEETIFIDIQLNPCTRDTILVKIADNPLLPSPLIEDTIICPGETVFQDVTLPVPIPPPASFTNSMVVPIDTEFVARSSDIEVVGIFPELLGPGVIQSVCINIEHRWVDDLDIFLVTPGGQFIELSTDNGADQDDYVDACFTEDATTVISFPGPVAPGSAAPFTGDWLPEGPWSDLYGGPTNGTWQLLVSDDSPGFDGEIIDWTITFNKIFDIFYEWTPDLNITCADCPLVDMVPPDSTTYVLEVSDTYGCRIIDSIEIAVLDTLPPPEINCDSITNSSIKFAWDTIPGSTGYEVSIDGGAWMLPNNGDFSQLMDGLGLRDTISIEVRGISRCGVKSDTLTCFTPVCAVPDLLVDSIKAVSCTGGSDGTVLVSGMGGVGGFVYTLDTESNSTGMFDDLAPGIYEVMVSDAMSCSRTIEIEILEPNPILLDMVLLDTLQCFGDANAAATVVVIGGTPPYTFSWDGGLQMDSIALGLGQGLHRVIVTDARACSRQEDIMIQEPSLLMATTDSTDVLCTGESTGIASVTPSGGTSPYTFLWDVNAGSQVTASATALGIGTYEVTITDDNNCTAVRAISINEPTELSGNITFENPLCPQSTDGTATVIPSGGTMPYNYLWSDPAASTLDSAINLGGEEYFVTVTDANGCTFDTSAILVSPDTFALVLTQTEVSCFGDADGSATATVMNSTGPETYLWSNMATTPSISLLSAQEYCVTVTDANGCEQSDCITISEPPKLQATATKTSAGCTGQSEGTIDLTVIGGESPYLFAWSNGSLTEDLANLPKGDYTVIISDANNCTATTTVTIEEGAPYSLIFDVENLSCSNENDGSIDLSTSGGFGITYQWTGPNGFASTTEDLDSLSPGTYVVMALDPQGCAVTDSVDVNGPDVIQVDYEIEEISCFGAQNGRVFFEVEGGTGPYSYAFGADTILQNLPFFFDLSGGVYPYTVQDAFGCEVSDSLTIVEPQELIITLGPNYEILLGESYVFPTEINFSNSIIDSILWSPIDSLSCIDCLTPTANPEYSQEYTIEIFAENGCTTKGHILLLVNRQVSVYIPSAFSPNGDRINDVLMVYGKAGSINKVVRFEVFNRWGGQVHGAYQFDVNDESAGWDGLLDGDRLNEAVFTWLVEIELLDGSREILTGDALIQY